MRKWMIALLLSTVAAPAFAQENNAPEDSIFGRHLRVERQAEAQPQVEAAVAPAADTSVMQRQEIAQEPVQMAQRGDEGRRGNWGGDRGGNGGGWQGRQEQPRAQGPVIQAPEIPTPVQQTQQAQPEARNWGGRGNWGDQSGRINPVPVPQAEVPQQQADTGRWNREGGGWRNRQQDQAVPVPQPQPRVENRTWNGDGNRWGNRSPQQQVPAVPQSGWNGRERNPQPVPNAPSAGQVWNRNDTGGWQRRDNARDNDRHEDNRGGNNQGWGRNDSGGWQRHNDDRRVDNRWGSNQGWNRDNNGGWQRRDDNRWGNNQSWNRGWRSDQRYNWQGYRNQYRSYYQQPRYYNPYGYGYSYERFGIGIYLDDLFFSSRYWISDPWQYRLPSAPYGYRWVRYYDDVILVNTRSGYVVDVIYNFFY